MALQKAKATPLGKSNKPAQVKSNAPEGLKKPKKRQAADEIVIQPSEKLEKKFKKLTQKSEQLTEQVESLEFPVTAGSESSYLSEYERMLQYNSRLIQRFNEQLKENLTSRDVYALSTLMSQQREVIADLRTLTDMSQQVGLIYDHAVTPFVSDLTQTVTDVYYQLRKLITETSVPKQTQFALSQLDELIKQIGMGLQGSHQKMRSSVEEILLGGSQDKKSVKRKK